MVAAEMEAGNGLHDRGHIGNAQALLLGDILFAWAQESFHGNRDFDTATQQSAQTYFNLMIDEVVLGEMLDVDMMTRLQTTQASIEKKMLLKTAAYTFVRPMQMGAALAGTGRRHEHYCSELGLSLGVAFQIQDDLLDIVGTPQTTHKTLFADLRDHQHTYFTQYIFEYGSSQEKVELRQLLGADLTANDYGRVLDLFERSGALDHGRERIRRHLDEACLLVENAPFCNPFKDPFRQLIATMRRRIPAGMTEAGLEHELVA
jgi:geranylgeranyl diphosphate synthase type I